MAGLSARQLRSRIRSMGATKQITRAMEMAAAAKLRHAETRLQGARPYYEGLYAALEDMALGGGGLSSAYLTERSPRRRLYIVIAGDRGLAGGYHGNILKLAQSQAEKTDSILPIGKKAAAYFEGRGWELSPQTGLLTPESGIGDCFTAARRLCRDFLEGEFDEVTLCYTRFLSPLTQRPLTMPLLPLKRPEEGTDGKGKPRPEPLWEGTGEDVLSAIVPEYLGGVLYGALCESAASEEAARRLAMDAAARNAGDMIADLSRRYNRVRQAAITQEIVEIVAGS